MKRHLNLEERMISRSHLYPQRSLNLEVPDVQGPGAVSGEAHYSIFSEAELELQMQSLGWRYIFPLVSLSRASAVLREFCLSISAYNCDILISSAKVSNSLKCKITSLK